MYHSTLLFENRTSWRLSRAGRDVKLEPIGSAHPLDASNIAWRLRNRYQDRRRRVDIQSARGWA
jgi:hypothetical protein